MLITHHWISNSRILILQTFSLGNQLVGVSTLKIPLGSDSLTAMLVNFKHLTKELFFILQLRTLDSISKTAKYFASPEDGS